MGAGPADAHDAAVGDHRAVGLGDGPAGDRNGEGDGEAGRRPDDRQVAGSRHRIGLDDRQVAGYLERIGVDGPVAATAEWLERAHVAHLMTVPFENLDIHAGRPIRLGLRELYDKVVAGNRGGFCYELNGLFAALLAAIGFDVRLVTSRVCRSDGSLTAPFDHAALLVGLDGSWLVDVGFGDAFTTPRPLGAEWSEPGRRLRTVGVDGGWRLEADDGAGWAGLYELDPTPRRLEEFADRCRWHQTAPESYFRQAPLVSRATTSGRVTLVGGRLIVTTDGARTERLLDAGSGPAEAARAGFDDAIVTQLRLLQQPAPSSDPRDG